MLRASRVVSASRRGFATVVDAGPGFKVAAVDNGQPSSSVTVLLNAGSRHQSKPGVAHALSNFAFKVRLLFFPSTYEQLGVALFGKMRCVQFALVMVTPGVFARGWIYSHCLLLSVCAMRNRPTRH